MASNPDPNAEWWNTTDVAGYLGVGVATVSQYRRRAQMPEPDTKVGRAYPPVETKPNHRVARAEATARGRRTVQPCS
jgi:hypothetical protein